MSELVARRAQGIDSCINRVFRSFCRHWLAWLNLLVGIWVALPWLAPVLMHLDAPAPARLIYLFYSPQCHQLPQRSYFLFGDRPVIPLQDILAVYPVSDPLQLRPFLGTPEQGWEVAWSDRMVSLFTPLFVGGLLYGLSGKCWQPMRWCWRLIVPYLPLAIDGASHGINNLFHLGFRETNSWLAMLSGNAFAPRFTQATPLARSSCSQASPLFGWSIRTSTRDFLHWSRSWRKCETCMVEH